MTENPYAPPSSAENRRKPPVYLYRGMFLLLPPVIPILVHAVVRCFVPSDEALYHGLFMLGALIIAWAWAQLMIERLRISGLKTYLLACAVWGAVVASALISSSVVDHLPFVP